MKSAWCPLCSHRSAHILRNPLQLKVLTYKDWGRLCNLADVIMAVDHYLEGRELNKPPSRYAYQIAQKSLHELIAA